MATFSARRSSRPARREHPEDAKTVDLHSRRLIVTKQPSPKHHRPAHELTRETPAVPRRRSDSAGVTPIRDSGVLSSRVSNKLKTVLVGGDSSAIFLAYFAAVTTSTLRSDTSLAVAGAAAIVATAVGLLTLRACSLWHANVSAVRAHEFSRLVRAALLTGVICLGIDVLSGPAIRFRAVGVAVVLTIVLLFTWRGAYRSWLDGKRTNGSYLRRVVIVGADTEAARLVELFRVHPEIGVDVVGVVGDRSAAKHSGLGQLWIGETDRAEAMVCDHCASGVVVAAGNVDADRLTRMIRTLQGTGVHVHLSTGLEGIAGWRLRSSPTSHEPLIYVEPPTLQRSQRIMKRVFDVTLGVTAVIASGWLMILIALLIKLEDGGPVFFRQERVGKGGRKFQVLKFRSMCTDAEAMMGALAQDNERHGPLFKMTGDPRVTRVGRFLRESSLDELPQFFNVIRNEMSIVGPRPALQSEVENFSAELRHREHVMPGITGLWQVEARDNPSFEAYRRLDLFYVENWSVTFDMVIVLRTAEQLITRLVAIVFSRRADTVAAPDQNRS